MLNQAAVLESLGRRKEARAAYTAAIGAFSSESRPMSSGSAAKHLLRILRETTDPRMAKIAAVSLGQCEDTSVIEDVMTILRGPGEPWRRAPAAVALGSLARAMNGHAALDVLPSLIERLHDHDVLVRRSVATALGQLGAKEAVPALISCLNDSMDSVRGRAATALGNIGAHEASGALIECLKDESSDVRGRSASALGSIGSEAATEPLIGSLQDEDAIVRRCAASALARIGSREAIEPLIGSLHDEDATVRRIAVVALGLIGVREAVPALIGCLKDEVTRVRGRAASALGNIGVQEAEVALIECLKDESASVRRRSATALGRIGDRESVEALAGCLQDGASTVRTSAAAALGRMAHRMPLPQLDKVVGILLQDLPESESSKKAAIVRMMLKAAFRSKDLQLIKDVIQSVRSGTAKGEIICAPHIAALAYLDSARDLGVLELQHPEMREAIELLVGAYDEGCLGTGWTPLTGPDAQPATTAPGPPRG
jgi:HEAT repeat protein